MKRSRPLRKTHLYSKTAKTLMVLLAGLILVANLYILSETKKLVASFSNQQNQATWYLFQLNKELQDLVSNASHLGDGDNHLPTVLLKYDLAWSRFDLLTSNKEADDFLSLEGTRTFFTQLFSEFREIEPLLETIEENQLRSSTEFIKKVSTVHQKLVQYTNRNFRMASPLYLERRSQVNNLEKMQTALFILLVICISLIGYVYSRELKYSRQLAMTDTLTSLPNRLALFNLVDDLNKRNCSFDFFLLDLDGFKQVNDKFGHQVGDGALIEVARRLNSIKKTKAYAFRMGGDEFALVVPVNKCCSGDAFRKVLEQVFQPLFTQEKIHYDLSTSIGFANFPEDSSDIDELIRCADQRMYQMKFLHRDESEVERDCK